MIRGDQSSSVVTHHETQDEERTPDGKKIMRMPQRPNGGSQRRTRTAPEVIQGLWEKATDQMRQDWLKVYCALLSAGGEYTAAEIAGMADEAFFEFHARCNPATYSASAG